MPQQSHQWISSDARELHRIHRERVRLCPRSPFLTAHFNLPAHKQAMQAATDRLEHRKLAYNMEIIERRQAEQCKTFPLPAPALYPAFGGKEFSTNHSAVLLSPTVFVHTFYKGKDQEHISDWPSRSEMRYEGDDRISTDILHRRFPAAPRVVGNGTVNWQQRTIIHPDWFDCFYPSMQEEDILIRSNIIPAREFTDLEGEVTLGKDLMQMMEYRDIW